MEEQGPPWPADLRARSGSWTTIVSQPRQSGWRQVPIPYPSKSQAPVLICSLIFVLDKPQQRVLLGLKKRGFGVGLWNGFGGKLDPHETIDQCAARELTVSLAYRGAHAENEAEEEEECGLTPTPEGMRHAGRMIILRPPLPPCGLEAVGEVIDVHIYICDAWTGAVTKSDEMRPEWYDFKRDTTDCGLPLDQMWPEASLFLRPLLTAAFDKTSAQKRQMAIWDDYDWLPTSSDAISDPLKRALRTTKQDGQAVQEQLAAYYLAWHE